MENLSGLQARSSGSALRSRVFDGRRRWRMSNAPDSQTSQQRRNASQLHRISSGDSSWSSSGTALTVQILVATGCSLSLQGANVIYQVGNPTLDLCFTERGKLLVLLLKIQTPHRHSSFLMTQYLVASVDRPVHLITWELATVALR